MIFAIVPFSSASYTTGVIPLNPLMSDTVSGSRKNCQTLEQVLASKELLPNTTHSQLEKRLCVSALIPGYMGTYRPEGLIFQTNHSPEYVVPFDMMALTSGRTFSSVDYDAQFLDGSEHFKYSTIDEMLKQFPSAEMAVKGLNAFRKERGLKPVNEKTMNYNECCFTSPVHILPVAIIGRGSEYQDIAERHNIPLYESMEEFRSVSVSRTMQ